MPDTTDLDWNAIEDIYFSFGKLPNPANADKHVRLNQAFSQYLDYEETDSLFIAHKEGTKTLGLNPVTILRELIIDEIFDCLPFKARTETTKQHIVTLFKLSTMWHIAANGSLGRIRNKATLDAAARQAIPNHSPVLHLQMQIPHWGFPKDWWPYDFMSVYDTNIYSFPKKSNTHKATPVADKTPNASRARFANLPQRKYIKPTAVPPQRKHIHTTARIPLMTANLGPLQSVGPIADTPSVKAPHDTWTWTYSPQSELVSFRRVRSDSLLCVTSSSPPDHKEKSSIVTAPSVSPSTKPSFDHHSAPPWKPTNFVWTFNPQNEVATFRRVPNSVPSPPSEPLAEVTDPPNAAPAYIRSLPSPYRKQLSSKPYYQPVLRLSKQHWDAIKVKWYHLYANILSMNWFYDTFD
eukprot:jgi/Psemu1/31826/gm1.31826_g